MNQKTVQAAPWIHNLFARMGKEITKEAVDELKLVSPSDISRLCAAEAQTAFGPNRTEIHATDHGVAKILVHRNDVVSKRFTVTADPKLVKRAQAVA